MSVFYPISLFLTSQVSLLTASSPSLDLMRGHYEVQMEYSAANGWWAGVTYTLGSNFDNPQPGDIGRIDAEDVEIVMPSLSRQQSNSASSFVVPNGTPIWRIPQGFQEGNHFLGFRVLIPNGAFQAGSQGGFFPAGSGNVNLRLLSLTGSGPERGGLLGTWQDGSGFTPPKIAFNTSNGISSEDEVSILPPGTHTHYNWVFSEPGVYHVNLEVYGRLANGTDSSHPFTLTFQVPHSGILSSLSSSLAFDGDDWALLCRDLDASVTYAERHCYLHATEPSTNAEVVGWQAPLSFAIDNPATSDTVGVAANFATTSPAFAGGVSLQLTQHVGPGEIVALDAGGGSLFDTRNGIDGNDAWLISAAARSGQLHFTEEGIHHLSFVATGLDSNGHPSSVSRPLTLRCGANLAADHSYADWANSYERAYGLATGSLGDPNENFDHDCLPNQLEYLLDVAGATPVGAEAVGRFDLAASPPRFIFMRDLHKDKMNDTSPALFPSQSFDLLSWDTLTAPNSGLPVRLHEVPVVSGNARSMFMERSLSNPLGDSRSSFFRIFAD